MSFPNSTGCSPDPRAALLDPYESSYVKKQECPPCSHPAEESCERSSSRLGWPSHVRKLLHSSCAPNEGPGTKSRCLDKSSVEFSTSPELMSVTPSSCFMGKFLKSRGALLPLHQVTTPTPCESHTGDSGISFCFFSKLVNRKVQGGDFS